MARRNHAGVAEARFRRDLAIAFEDDDVVAVPLQLIGGGDADHAAAKHHYAHGEFALPPERRADFPVDSVCSGRRFIAQ